MKVMSEREGTGQAVLDHGFIREHPVGLAWRRSWRERSTNARLFVAAPSICVWVARFSLVLQRASEDMS